MKSKLGIYFISLGGMDVVDYISRSGPRIVVSMDHNVDMWRTLRQCSPNTFVIGRHFVDDPDQLYADDPEGRAEQFFNAMRPEAERMRGLYDAWMSYNEIDLGKDDGAPERARRLSRFHVRWGDLMRQAGFVSCAYSFATGNPAKGDPKPDGSAEPNLWPFLLDGLAHCDLLSLHEYSAPQMSNLQGWLCLRYRAVWEMLPAAVRRPIVITECGLDGGPVGRAQQGWSKFTDEAGYLQSLRWYDAELQKDPYVIGATIFAANGWGIDGSFGMGNLNQVRDYIAQGGSPAPVSIHLPPAAAPGPAPAVPAQPAAPAAVPPAAPAGPAAPGPAGRMYTIRPGDSLFRIALQFGVKVDAIIRANNIPDPNRIRPGQVLQIPPK